MQLLHQMLVTLILPMCDSGIWRQFEMMMSFRNPSPGNVNLNKNFTITAEQQVHFEWTLRSTRNYGTHESLWCNCFTKCWWLWKLAPIRSYDAISMTAAKTFPRKLKNLSTIWPSCQVNITSPMIANSYTPTSRASILHASSASWSSLLQPALIQTLLLQPV